MFLRFQLTLVISFAIMLLTACQPEPVPIPQPVNTPPSGVVNYAQDTPNNISIRIDWVEITGDLKEWVGDSEVYFELLVIREVGDSRRLRAPGQGTYNLSGDEQIPLDGFSLTINDLHENEEVFVYLLALESDELGFGANSAASIGMNAGGEALKWALENGELAALVAEKANIATFIISSVAGVALDWWQEADIIGEYPILLQPNNNYFVGKVVEDISQNGNIKLMYSILPGNDKSPVIAFMSKRDGNAEIYAMNEDGSMQKNLTNKPTNDYWPQWSPDGSRIVFHSYRLGEDAADVNSVSDIYTMDAMGVTWVRLTNNGATNKFADWSPDGMRIVYVSDISGDYEIYSMDSDGTQSVRLTDNPAKEYFPMWSPSGLDILFDSDRDGNNEIYSMRVDGSRQTNLTNHLANDSMASWSPSGDKIAFSSNRSGQPEIWLMNKEGGDLKQLTYIGGQQPRWSSDGSRIVFFSTQDGNQEIYVVDSDGRNLTRLTESSADDRDPSWSN